MKKRIMNLSIIFKHNNRLNYKKKKTKKCGKKEIAQSNKMKVCSIVFGQSKMNK